jgi:PQQ-dependent dehydrogenase (methanol/ethanol family)
MRTITTVSLASLLVFGLQEARAQRAATDWPMYAGDYASTGASSLSEITPRNVSTLKPICSYKLPEVSTFESSLVAVNGTLYFTTSDDTYAVDAAVCTLKWRAHHETQVHGTVRGVAVSGNRVFRGFRDGTMAAYDINTGDEVWATQIKESDGSPATIAASPTAWNGMVFIGTSGAERACGCIVAGLDAESGRVIWTFALVPTGDAPGADTWPKGVHVGGGSVWTSLTLDADAGALYVPAGNPGPDFSGAYRPGANLYTNSIVVLDAKTGSLRTWYQLVPHDVHDWDQSAAPALLTTKQGRKRAMAAGKAGFLHAIDIVSGKIAWNTPVTTIENIDAPLTPQGTYFCPGTAGGVQWNGPRYSAVTNLVYVNSVDRNDVEARRQTARVQPGRNSGLGERLGDKDRARGWVTAVDADTGIVRWRFQSPAPLVAGATITASGLVLTGDLQGNIFAFDAATGKVLRRIATGQPVGGGVITYQAGGKQRIAVAAGLLNNIFQTKGEPVVIVYGL